jgi:electron-transferring-flavoprotein dehydrogenase
MKSGILAAESAYDQLSSLSPDSTAALDLSSYEESLKKSYVYSELNEVRNLRPSFHNPLGNYGGIIYSGIDSLLLKGRVPWTFRKKTEDFQDTRPARCASSLSDLPIICSGWSRSVRG